MLELRQMRERDVEQLVVQVDDGVVSVVLNDPDLECAVEHAAPRFDYFPGRQYGERVITGACEGRVPHAI